MRVDGIDHHIQYALRLRFEFSHFPYLLRFFVFSTLTYRVLTYYTPVEKRMQAFFKKDFAEYRLNEALSYIDRRKKLGFISDEDYLKKKETFLREYKDREASTSEKEIFAYPFTYGKQEIDEVFPLKKYAFAGTYFYGPNNYDKILASEYRDYMSLPPEEDRKPHYTAIKFF